MWSEMLIGLRVQYLLFLSDSNWTRIFVTDFRKTLKFEIVINLAIR